MRYSVGDVVTANDAVVIATVNNLEQRQTRDVMSENEDFQSGSTTMSTSSTWMTLPPPPPPPPPPPCPPLCPPPCPALSSFSNPSSAANSSCLVHNGDVIAGSCSSSRCHQVAAPIGCAMSSQNGVTTGAVASSPRQRLRKLQWSKLPANKVVGQTNVWTTSDRMFGSSTSDGAGYRLDFDRMEQLFAVPQPSSMCASSSTSSLSNATVGMTSPSGSPVAGAKYPLSGGQTTIDGRTSSVPRLLRKQSEEINLLDSRRSLNVNVFLRQFRSLSNADLVLMIARGESEAFGAEKLRCLIRILPPEDERQCLTSFTGDRSRLGNAEKFCMELMDISQYEDRIEAMFLKEEFSQSVDRLKSSLDAFIHTASQLKTNSALHEVLYMVLIAGNFLNAGGHAGDAVGFRLSSLPSLVELRANKPRMTLLHYVAMEAEEKKPDLLVFPEQLPRLKEASECTVESIKVDVSSLSERLESVSSRVRHLDQVFQRAIVNFIKTAKTDLDMMKSRLAEVDALRSELAVYYCEDETTFQLDDAFKIWDSFCDKFRRAVKENKERRTLEEKAEQRRKQMEERMKSLDECFTRRGSLDPSRDASRDSASIDSDGGDLVGALLGASTVGGTSSSLASSSGQGRSRIRSRSVTDTAGGNRIPRQSRDVMSTGNRPGVSYEHAASSRPVHVKHPDSTGNGNNVGQVADIRTGYNTSSAQQQDRSTPASRSLRLTSSFDDGCCNRERVATASVQEPSSVTGGNGGQSSRLKAAPLASTSGRAEPDDDGSRTSYNELTAPDQTASDDRDRPTQELHLYVEKIQQLNEERVLQLNAYCDDIGKGGIKADSGNTTIIGSASTGVLHHRQPSRRALPAKPGEVQAVASQSMTRRSGNVGIQSPVEGSVSVSTINKTRTLSESSKNSASSSSIDSQKLATRGAVQQPQQQGQTSRSNRPDVARPNRPSQPSSTPASPPVVMGDIANRRVQLPVRLTSSRTPLVSSNNTPVKIQSVLQPRRSFGSSASYSAPVSGRTVTTSDRPRGSVTQTTSVTSPSASTGRRVPVTPDACAAIWKSSSSSSSGGPDARMHQQVATAENRRGSLGKTFSSRQRELTSRLSQPKTPASTSRRSSDSGIVDCQSPDPVPVRQIKSSTQPARAVIVSRSDTGSDHGRRRSTEDPPPRSATSGNQIRSLETALAVAAAKRKDLRRQQEVMTNNLVGLAKTTPTSPTQSPSDVVSATSVDAGLSAEATPSKKETLDSQRGRNGYLSSTTSAQAKFRQAERVASASRLEDINVDSRRGRDSDVRPASAGRPGERNTSLVHSSNSSIGGRRRGSNSSTTSSTGTSRRQSVEQLDADKDTNRGIRSADRSNSSSTVSTPSSAASRSRGLLVRQGEVSAGAAALNKANGPTATEATSVCNRLRCKPSTTHPQSISIKTAGSPTDTRSGRVQRSEV